MEPAFLFLILFVAYLYSSVGHGGASGYLALMALFGVETAFMRSSALTLNLFVAGVAFMIYLKAGYFRWRNVMPFLLTSIPFSALGAMVHIDPYVYKVILGLFLLIAVARIIVKVQDFEAENDPPLPVGLLLGSVLGFFSGMIGIGGGIILTPLLLLMRWANAKEAAASSALFIFLNSASGLLTLQVTGHTISPGILYWIMFGLAGAFLGSYSGSLRFTNRMIQYVLAGVLLVASLKLFVL